MATGIKERTYHTMSVPEYCNTFGRNLLKFEYKGIYITGDAPVEDLLKEFKTKIPKGAEAIVDFQLFEYTGHHTYIHGTALIPKNSKKSSEQN